MTAEKEVGRRLSAAMALRGMTPPTLSEVSGVNRQTIWRYMTGRSTQAFVVMARLAKALKVRLDYLAYGSGNIESR